MERRIQGKKPMMDVERARRAVEASIAPPAKPRGCFTAFLSLPLFSLLASRASMFLFGCDEARNRTGVRHRAWIATVILLVLCGWRDCAAQEKFGQWIHTSWIGRDGAPANIEGITRGPNGFLYVIARSGLFRFDGTTFEKVKISGQKDLVGFPPRLIRLSNGDIWVSIDECIAVIHEGRFQRLLPTSESTPKIVWGFGEDHLNRVWAAASNGLFVYSSGKWQRLGDKDGLPVTAFRAVFESHDGTMWASVGTAVYARGPGEAQFHDRHMKGFEVLQFREDHDGRIWVVDSGISVHPIDSPRLDDPVLKAEVCVGADEAAFDREGELWIASLGDGLRRLPHPEKVFTKIAEFSRGAEIFTKNDGLTADVVRSIYVDDDGGVWTGSKQGLDYFRKSRIVSKPDVSGNSKTVMMPGAFGDTWYMNQESFGHLWPGPNEVQSQEVEFIGDHQHALPPVAIKARFQMPAPTVCTTGTPGVLCSDRGWAGVTPYPVQIPEGYQRTIAWFDRKHTMWLATQDYGDFYRDGNTWKPVPVATGRPVWFPSAQMDAPDGSEWLAFGNLVVRVMEGKTEELAWDKQLDIGVIRAMVKYGDHIWFGGSSGICLYDHGKFSVIRSEDIDGLTAITSMQQTPGGNLWVATVHGLIYISSSEVQRALQDSSYHPAYESLGPLEGSPGTAIVAEQLSADGILYVMSNEGAGYLDTNHFQEAAPIRPVLRAIESNGSAVETAEHIVLGPGVTNFKLQFVGIDFADPRNVTYKYRLSGVDKDWQNAGTGQQAAYTNLPPGEYTFHVMTKRAAGPWSQDYQLVSLYLKPTWYQRVVTKIAAALALLGLAFSIFWWRLKLARKTILSACDARLEERLRLSADIHDMFLQSVQGSKLIADDALERADQENVVRQSLERLCSGLERAVDEGRRVLRSLRTNEGFHGDLAKVLPEIAAQECKQDSLLPSVSTEGTVRPLHPVVQDEVIFICREAIRNACAHSRGTKLALVVTYGRDFAVAVSDDGVGISPTVLAKGKEGHFGLACMRQRAAQIGGRLKIANAVTGGVTVLVEVPGRVAYVGRR